LYMAAMMRMVAWGQCGPDETRREGWTHDLDKVDSEEVAHTVEGVLLRRESSSVTECLT
jgi:hypothetical protein